MKNVGVDILELSRLRGLDGQWDDPFFRRAFTPRERAFCLSAGEPLRAFAGCFCGKEAVFKSLGIPSDGVRLDQIEILRNDFGQPTVTLAEPLRALTPAIRQVHLSLSYEREVVVAFALSE